MRPTRPGVCYFALDGHVAFAETLLRDTEIEVDDSGDSVALFDRAAGHVHPGLSIELLDPPIASLLADWLRRYGLTLTS